MNTTMLAVMLVLGIIGHAINRWCDYVLSVYPEGRMTLDSMKDINDERRFARLVRGADPERMFQSAMYGTAAVLMEVLGYAAIAYYVYSYQRLAGLVLFLCTAMYGVLGAGHHVKYALAMWVYLRTDCSSAGYQMLQEIYNRLPITKACYAGYLVYIGSLIVTVITGATPMPPWMAAFTVSPVFIVMLPFRIIGTVHISGIITFAMWLAMILLTTTT